MAEQVGILGHHLNILTLLILGKQHDLVIQHILCLQKALASQAKGADNYLSFKFAASERKTDLDGPVVLLSFVCSG